MAKATRFRVERIPDKELGTVTFKQDFTCEVFGDSFTAGQTVQIGKAMLSPFGEGYYKVFGTKVWVTAKEVTDINVTMAQKRTYRSIL
jgi:hypothetical protein